MKKIEIYKNLLIIVITLLLPYSGFAQISATDRLTRLNVKERTCHKRVRSGSIFYGFWTKERIIICFISIHQYNVLFFK